MATLKKRREDILQQLLISEGHGTEKGGHSPYTPWEPAPKPDGGYVPAPKRDKMTIASTPQSGAYPTTPSYINYKEIRDINPFLIDKFIRLTNWIVDQKEADRFIKDVQKLRGMKPGELSKLNVQVKNKLFSKKKGRIGIF